MNLSARDGQSKYVTELVANEVSATVLFEP